MDANGMVMRRVHIVTFTRDGAPRTFTLRRSILAVGAMSMLSLVLWAGFSLYVMMFHDTLVEKLIADQEQMRQGYEQQLAAERLKLDHAASMQASARSGLEDRLRELLSRQAQLETRTETVAQMLRGANGATPSGQPGPAQAARAGTPTSVARRPDVTPASDPLLAINNLTSQKPRPVDDNGSVSSYAEEPGQPANPPVAPTFAGPESSPPVSSSSDPRASIDGSSVAFASPIHVPQSIDTLTNALDRVERLQVETLRQANVRATSTIERIRSALRSSGLDPRRFVRVTKNLHGIGGPFVPLPSDVSANNFETLSHVLQTRLEEHDALSHALSSLPIRQPFPGEMIVNSPFGSRKDPFGMGWALHPGVDLHAGEGTIVHATASGKVTNAGYAGGYGNMVEIDHGEGLSTRYGHLSAILVSDGQVVQAGTPIGRVGSTGRSTGPHLHYETRIDGVPVDPMRFLDSSPVLLAAIRGTS